MWPASSCNHINFEAAQICAPSGQQYIEQLAGVKKHSGSELGKNKIALSLSPNRTTKFFSVVAPVQPYKFCVRFIL